MKRTGIIKIIIAVIYTFFIILSFITAYSLFSKGAKLKLIFTYIGAAAIVRIPMTVFEASFLGVKFTAIRIIISIPLVIISSNLLGNFLTKHNFQINKGK